MSEIKRHMPTPKLIILRGPSGSGKSTVAKRLFEGANGRTCLLSQDYYRFIFKPAGGGSRANTDSIHRMIKSNTLIALEDGYDVILEGILSVRSYSEVLDEIFDVHTGENYMFYFDVSYEETIRRHNSRKTEDYNFNEKDMLEWYPNAHRSNHRLEKIIPEEFTLDQTVEFIKSTSNF